MIETGNSAGHTAASTIKLYRTTAPSTSPISSLPSPPNSRQQQQQQQTGRRGHLKSRLGCFNCKRRRVKCNEQRPSCNSCRRLGLSCAYPTAAVVTGAVRANPSPLSLEDLRFYHRFLTTAFPTLPLRDDKVWEHCTAMSHQFECLAHAVLALGASHLTQHGHVDYTPQALHHRVAAIRLVNEQFVNPPKNADKVDAMFAAVFCLSAQTTLLPDGMSEYLTITRAGALIWAFIIPEHENSAFVSFTLENHSRGITEIVSEVANDYTVAEGFLESVTRLRPLCQKPYEVHYYDRIVSAINSLYISSLQAWRGHADLWRAHCFFSNEDFQVFADPDNFPCQLLIIHMFLLDYVLGPFCVPSTEQFRFPARKQVIISWARNLVKRLPEEYLHYSFWISDYCNTLEHSEGNHLLTP